MFDRLKNKWGVGGFQLFLIICTFALGGTLCGRAGKMILEQLSIEKGILWFILYLILITILWPIAVILVSIPLGQFRFFRNYVGKIAHRISGKK